MTSTVVTETPDTATVTIPTDTAAERAASPETPTIIDFKDIPPIAEVSPARRWWLIGGSIAGSIVFSTVATVLARVVTKRLSQPRQLMSAPLTRRFGVRHIRASRGASAWIVYTYRLPQMRVRLPRLAFLTGWWQRH